MPWPGTSQNILGGIDITISDIPTERTQMRTDRQGFLHDLATSAALLRGEARIDSDHLMPSTCSLDFKDSEKRAPTGIHDALCQGMILDHIQYLKLLNSDHLIVQSILLGCLIVEIAALPLDLQMRLRGTASSLATARAALLTPCYRTLFAPERFLQGARVPWVLDRLSFAISQKRQEAHINADSRM
jgi:hypothetical protein